jgi:uncharacterized protein (TIGR02246 family)
MSFMGPVEDRLAIRERVEAYADAVFRRNADDWIANWAEDATWILPGLEVTGRETIKAAWLQAMSAFPLAAFFAVPGSIRVGADTAQARVYTQEVLVLAGGGVRRIVGAYDDELVKIRGEWLFSRRAYRILHDETGA